MATMILKIEQPDKVDVTLTLTMPLGDWKMLKNQLDSKYPSWVLSQAISAAVRHVEEKYGHELALES